MRSRFGVKERGLRIREREQENEAGTECGYSDCGTSGLREKQSRRTLRLQILYELPTPSLHKKASSGIGSSTELKLFAPPDQRKTEKSALPWKYDPMQKCFGWFRWDSRSGS